MGKEEQLQSVTRSYTFRGFIKITL
ncbi:hypothetical protein NMYAN_20311 [Nitrosomonas nitrosa]|uniref:Uncharacterized protein n=1 Tax=Nitrosomonas nitrosa TaxID=52442 RepID=A0A8H8YZ27_9PROT|nr:hypothetical protein NMYAN_20311 [Nitrosomonas nitrosa]